MGIPYQLVGVVETGGRVVYWKTNYGCVSGWIRGVLENQLRVYWIYRYGCIGRAPTPRMAGWIRRIGWPNTPRVVGFRIPSRCLLGQ